MERVKCLNWYQKGILLLLALMFLVFTVLYPVTIAREGFDYQDAILLPAQQNGSTVYFGKIQGTPSSFTVYADKTVEFRYGDKTYGPYTYKEDPTAIPEDRGRGGSVTGVELRLGDEILFRGSVVDDGTHRWLYSEDGSLEEMLGLSVMITTEHGYSLDEDGNVVDPMEPSAATILDLMTGPTLTHRGDWFSWLGGVLLCIAAAASILYADELFYWSLSFQVRNAEQVEPSDWEIAGRYIAWTAAPVIAMIVFLRGLR